MFFLLIGGNYCYAGLSVCGKSHAFILSVLAAGLIIRSAGLFESSVWYSAKAKYRPNEIPLGNFNFKIIHENVDNIN